MQSPNARLNEIRSSLLETKRFLHFWDAVDNRIDDLLEEMEGAGPLDEKKLEQFAKQRDDLRKLAFGEAHDNLRNLEKMETGLRAVAVAGLAVPSAVFGAVYAAPWLAGLGLGTLAKSGVLIAGGALANGAVGGFANFVGQSLFGKTNDGWDAVKAHAQAGAFAGGLASVAGATEGPLGFAKQFFWGESWRTRVPWILAGGTSAVAYVASQKQKTAGFLEPEKFSLPFPSLDDPRYQQLTISYAQLLKHCLDQKDKNHLEILFQHARRSPNPEIQELFSQIYFEPLNKSGEFATLHRDRQNLCLNFSGSVKELPCEAGSRSFIGSSGATHRYVEENISLEGVDLEKDFVKEISGFKINQPSLTPDEAVALLLKAHGSPTLVRDILRKTFSRIHLPEGAIALSWMLLNLFMKSKEIASDAKYLYADLIYKALLEYQQPFAIKRAAKFQPAFVTVKSEPQVDTETGEFYKKESVQDPAVVREFFEELRREKEGLFKALALYTAKAPKQWAFLDDLYADSKKIEYQLFHLENYSGTVEGAYWEMLGAAKEAGKKDGQIVSDGYMVRIRSVNDVWRSEISFEGGLMGAMAGVVGLNAGLSETAKTAFKAQNFWQKAIPYTPWILAGIVVYPNIAAVIETNIEARELKKPCLGFRHTKCQ